MSAFYEALAAEAKALIQELGRPITFLRYAKGQPGDLLEGTVTRTEIGRTVLSGAVVPASGGTLEAFDVRFMDGAMTAGDVRFALVSTLQADGSAAGFQPGPGDEAEFEGRTWLVMGNTPVNVDGTPVVFSIGFRGP